MEVSLEVHTIIKYSIYGIFFLSDGGVYDVMVRLSLIKQIIKDVDLMSIAFVVKYPQIFWKS